MQLENLFESARAMPQEVSFEEVRTSFLSSPPKGRGKNDSLFFNKFWAISIVVAISSWFAFYLLNNSDSTEIKTSSMTREIAESNRRDNLKLIDPLGVDPIQSVSNRQLFSPMEQIPFPQYEDQPFIVQKEEKKKAKTDPSQESHITDEKSSSYSSVDWAAFHTSPVAYNMDRKAGEQSYIILNTDSSNEVAIKLGRARESNIRISHKRLKIKNGKVKDLELAFAVPKDDAQDCKWRHFLKLNLRKFKKLEYGWTLGSDGRVIKFWYSVNDGKVKYQDDVYSSLSIVKIK